MNIKKKLQLLCKKQNITIKEFELDSGLKVGTVGRWDTNIPSIDKVIKAADYFGVTLDYLTDRGQPSAQDAGLSEVQQALISAIPQLPDEVVSLLLSGAKDWLNNHKSQDGLSQSG